MPKPLLSIIPSELAREIEERYEKLGAKYLTDQTTEDGRPINGLMFTSRIENCREEVVDAVFCILGWIFKSNVPTGNLVGNMNTGFHLENGGPPDSAYDALRALINVYGICVAEYERDPNI